ncbi:MAG: response regulator [Desulfarculus sp.]|nr:response regulator [Desulfarculus sp.]
MDQTPASQAPLLSRFLRGQFFTGPLEPGDSLRYWRERVLFYLYLFGALGGLVSIGLDLWYWLPRGQAYIGIQTSSIVAWSWAVLIWGHRMPFGLRAGAVLAVCYGLGLSLLLRLGPISNGLPVLLCFNVVGAMLFGRRGALLTWLAAALTWSGLLIHLHQGGLDPALWMTTPSRLVVLAGNYLLFSALASAGVASLVHGLQSTVQAERQAKEDLDSQRVELSEVNRRLSQEVQTRRATQEALFQSQERLRAVLDSLDAWVYVADLETHEVLFANRKLRQDIGQDPQGRPCWQTLHQGQEGPCDFCTNYLLVDLEGQPLAEPYLWELRDPHSGRWQALHDRAIRWLDGRLVRLTVALDIGDRVAAEEARRQLEGQLRQAQKMEAVGTLAGGIAHDFNNILAAVMGHAEQGQKLCRQGQDVSPLLAKILEASERARDLIRRILAFSRKMEVSLVTLDLNQDVRQAVQMLKHAIPKMIAIETHLAADLLPVTGDSSQMQQIIINLATNAVDAMPQGGRLVIETVNVTLDREYCRRHLEVSPGPHVLLMVSDTGSGMDSRTLEQAFDPFFTTKEVGRGTGLGLSTVHGIVKALGGHIFAYSEPGLGTTFKIYLPAFTSAAQAPAPPPPLPEELLGGHETILLVDDEESLREMGAVALEEMGYRTLTAGSGEEALDIYRAQGQEVDLVVLDLGMPGMGGHQCLREILAQNPQARVMIASGYSANGLVRQSLQGGALAYVAKPFKRVDLLATVREVLDRRRD